MFINTKGQEADVNTTSGGIMMVNIKQSWNNYFQKNEILYNHGYGKRDVGVF